VNARGRLGIVSLLGVSALFGGIWFATRAAVRGQLTLDLGIGRTVRPLGPMTIRIAAPREIVFDVAAAPYGTHPPRDVREHVEVLVPSEQEAEGRMRTSGLQRSAAMVLAAHRTPVGNDVAVTVETVVLERPRRIAFFLVRGPVPHVSEEFVFEGGEGDTELTYRGELGADLWALGRWWGDRVASVWEEAVRTSLEQIRDAAETRARNRPASG
jgi:hypothetical protein